MGRLARGVGFCVVVVLFCSVAVAQTPGIKVQWTPPPDTDLKEYRLCWSTTTGIYTLCYTVPISEYLPPPDFMNLPVSLEPGMHYFAVRAVDLAGGEGPWSDESDPFTVLDKVPGGCGKPKVMLP
jgi:hypothetical protein